MVTSQCGSPHWFPVITQGARITGFKPVSAALWSLTQDILINHVQDHEALRVQGCGETRLSWKQQGNGCEARACFQCDGPDHTMMGNSSCGGFWLIPASFMENFFHFLGHFPSKLCACDRLLQGQLMMSSAVYRWNSLELANTTFCCAAVQLGSSRCVHIFFISLFSSGFNACDIWGFAVWKLWMMSKASLWLTWYFQTSVWHCFTLKWTLGRSEKDKELKEGQYLWPRKWPKIKCCYKMQSHHT